MKIINQLRKRRLPARVFALFLLFSITCTSLATLYSVYINEKIDEWALETDDNTIYLRLCYESDPTELPDTQETLQKMTDLYQQLCDSPSYTYYEIYTQPLFLCSASGTNFFDEWGEFPTSSGYIACAQISRNVQTDFQLSTSQGRLFEESDFLLSENASIPVLMGSAYASSYQLGDSFYAAYLYDVYSFTVVGFLDEGSTIERSDSTIPLDECIVMPSLTFAYTPSTDEGYLSQKIHYASMLCGKLRIAPEDFDAVYSDVTDLLSDCSFMDFSWVSSYLGDVPVLWNMNLHTIKLVSAVLSVILFALSILSIVRIIWQTHWNRLWTPFLCITCAVVAGIIASYLSCSLILLPQSQMDFIYPWLGSILTGVVCIGLSIFLLLWKQKKTPFSHNG